MTLRLIRGTGYTFTDADRATIERNIREAVARYHAIVATLVRHGVCVERACQLADLAEMEDPS